MINAESLNILTITATIVAAFLFGWLVGHLTSRKLICRVNGSAFDTPSKDDAIVASILRDIDSVPMGSIMVITYPGFLKVEQRIRLQQMVEEKVGERMKVMVLEGGLKATVLTETEDRIAPGLPRAAEHQPPPPGWVEDRIAQAKKNQGEQG